MVEPRARKYHRDRVAETLREEISGMIVGELADPRISFAYVSEVVLNPGGKSARVYIAVDGGEVEEEKTRESLTAAQISTIAQATRKTSGKSTRNKPTVLPFRHTSESSLLLCI